MSKKITNVCSDDFGGISTIEIMEFPLLFETLCFMYGKPNPRRFADECDLVYRVALGMTGKAYRISHGIERGESVRKHLTNEQIELLDIIQLYDLGMLIGCPNYVERKIKLEWLKMKWIKNKCSSED